jgi:hypothetical protein
MEKVSNSLKMQLDVLSFDKQEKLNTAGSDITECAARKL